MNQYDIVWLVVTTGVSKVTAKSKKEAIEKASRGDKNFEKDIMKKVFEDIMFF